MRCRSCNCNLSDFESTRKHRETGEYIDMCNRCFSPIAKEIPVLERADLIKNEEMDSDEVSYIDNEEWDDESI